MGFVPMRIDPPLQSQKGLIGRTNSEHHQGLCAGGMEFIKTTFGNQYPLMLFQIRQISCLVVKLRRTREQDEHMVFIDMGMKGVFSP